MGNYLSYMNYVDANTPENAALLADVPEGRLLHSALFSAGFVALNALLPFVLPKIFPRFDQFSESTRRKFVFYVSSFVHHIIVVPWSLRLLFKEYQGTRTGVGMVAATNGFREHHFLTRFSTGYFVGDIIGMIPDLLKGSGFDMFTHHIIALILVGAFSVEHLRYLSHFLVCESSSIFLNIMWMLRQYKQINSLPYNVAAGCFLGTFTLTRIINMPMMMWAGFTTHSKYLDKLGVLKYLLPVVQGLQFFWYSKILAQFVPLVQGALLGGSAAKVSKALTVTAPTADSTAVSISSASPAPGVRNADLMSPASDSGIESNRMLNAS